MRNGGGLWHVEIACPLLRQTVELIRTFQRMTSTSSSNIRTYNRKRKLHFGSGADRFFAEAKSLFHLPLW